MRAQDSANSRNGERGIPFTGVFFQPSVCIIGRPKCQEQTKTYDSKCRPDSSSCFCTENNIHAHFRRHLIAGALRMSGYYLTYLPTIRYLHWPFHLSALILAALCWAAVSYSYRSDGRRNEWTKTLYIPSYINGNRTASGEHIRTHITACYGYESTTYVNNYIIFFRCLYALNSELLKFHLPF